MKRKAISMLSVLIAGTVLLSACGGGAAPTSQNGAPAQKVDRKSTEVIKGEKPEALPTTAKNRKDTLIVGIASPNGKFNPVFADAEDDMFVTSIIFDGLLTNDATANMQGLIADKWEVSADSKTYTFHLKKGVKFTSGDEVTADDVAFTYTAICDPNYDGARTDAVNGLVGYEEYNKKDAKTVEGIKVIDPLTISFTYKEIYAPALGNNFGYGILSKKYYGFEKGNIAKMKDLFLKPMGTGAYKLKDYQAGQTVSLEKNDAYFRGTPKIPYVVMKVTNAQTMIQELKSGGVDLDRPGVKPENIEMLKAAGFIDMQLFPKSGYGFMGVNEKLDMFKDKRVRQALVYGFNRKGFVDSYFKGYADVCNTAISQVSWAYVDPKNKYEYSPEKANKLLDEAGWVKKEDGYRYKDGKKFTIHWMANTGSKYVDSIIPIVIENWKAIGIEVVPELLEFATMNAKVTEKREFEMFLMSWSTGLDPDPSVQYVKAQDVPGGFNNVGFNNDENEKLLKAGVETIDQTKRKEIYTKWQDLMAEEMPYILVDQRKMMYAVSSRVKNMTMTPYEDWTYYLYKAELAQ